MTATTLNGSAVFTTENHMAYDNNPKKNKGA